MNFFNRGLCIISAIIIAFVTLLLPASLTLRNIHSLLFSPDQLNLFLEKHLLNHSHMTQIAREAVNAEIQNEEQRDTSEAYEKLITPDHKNDNVDAIIDSMFESLNYRTT